VQNHAGRAAGAPNFTSVALGDPGTSEAYANSRYLDSSAILTLCSQVLYDGLVSIDSAPYSSSISLSPACWEERPALVGSGELDATLRSIAMR
jgi:hypothetical protein